jgi:hypothetical protein
MTTYRQRKDQAGRLRDGQPCPMCGHELGAHRGVEWDCIAEGCPCHRFTDDDDPTDEACAVCGSPAEDHA